MLIGIAVPSLIFGKSAIAVTMIPALLLGFAFPGWVRIFLSGRAVLTTPAGIAFGVTAILWLGGVFHSLDFRLSFEAWARTLFLACGMVFMARVIKKCPEMISLALRTMLVATAIACVLAYSGLAVPEILGFIHAKGWTPQNTDTGLKQFSAVAMLLVPVVIWGGFRLRGAWTTLGLVNAAALVGILIVASSRSSMAGLFAMLAVVGGVVVWQYGSRRQITAFAGILILGLAAIMVWAKNLHQASWVSGMADNFTIPAWMIDLPRQEIWAFTLGKALESPWIGHGINVVNYLPGANQFIDGMGLTKFISGHPHNWALEILAETGFIGLISVLVLVVLMFVALVRIYRRTQSPEFLVALAVNAGYWVSGLFNFSFWSVWWQVSYFTLFAFTYAAGSKSVGAERNQAATVQI